MDRDYSMETERELCFCTGQVNNNDVELAPVSSSTYINSQYYMNFDLNIYSQLNIYEHIGNGTAACFCNVRQYDSTYTIVAGNSMIVSLENYKNELQSICDCLSVPNIGCNVADINYNLGRYGDSLLYNSIFDGGGRYASVVAANGFNEVILNSDSASAAEYLYNRIITVNSDGNVDYDMDVLLEVMARSAEDITEAEYAAIAMAYLYMDDTDMTEFVKACMVESSEELQLDDKKWTLDDQKYNSIYDKIIYHEKCTLDSLCMNSILYNKVGDRMYEKKADELYDLSCVVAQRRVLFETLEILIIDGDKKPTINIKNKENKYIVQFDTFNTDARIDISPCIKNVNSVGQYCNIAREKFNDRFAEGYTPDGFESKYYERKYYMEHLFGGIKDISFGTIGNIGTGISLLEGTFTLYNDKEEGMENAKLIQDEFDGIALRDFCSIFGCDIIQVTYKSPLYTYEEINIAPGRYTPNSVAEYNSGFPQDIITYNDLCNNSAEIYNKISQLKDSDDLEIIEATRRAGGKN